MASVGTEIEPTNDISTSEDILPRVRAYLGIWRIGDAEWIETSSREIAERASRRLVLGNDIAPERAAIEEADAFLRDWFASAARANFEPAAGQSGVPEEIRRALVFGSARSPDVLFADPTQVTAALKQGAIRAVSAVSPSRPPETRAMVMQTSLSRLPSTRLIGGWALLIALLVLTFFLTH